MKPEELPGKIDETVRSLGIEPLPPSPLKPEPGMDYTSCSSQQLGQAFQFYSQQFAYICYEVALADAKATAAEGQMKRRQEILREKYAGDTKWQTDARINAELAVEKEDATNFRLVVKALEAVKEQYGAVREFLSREITRRESEFRSQMGSMGQRIGGA